MAVDSQHPEYMAAAANWQLLRDFITGEDAVKAGKAAYLPVPQGRDQPGSTTEYDNYVERATFLGATGKTVEAMAGAMFRRAPTVNLPASLEYLADDADGLGTPLVDLAKLASCETAGLGRVGLLVDYPAVGDVRTLQEERSLNARAQIYVYRAEHVINWHTERVGSQSLLTLVVLQESADKPGDDEFMRESETQYRVLRLVRNAGPLHVTSETYTRKGDDYVGSGQATLMLPGKKPLDRIPFVFLGAQDLTPNIDKSPVLDIARVNLAHYRNSADYEDALFMLGQPTPWVTGLSQSWIDQNKGGLVIGSRTAWLLPENSAVGLMELTNNLSAFRDAIAAKEKQMGVLGARIFDQGPEGVEAAQTVRLRQSGEASVLSALSSNVGRAFQMCLDWCALWMGGENATFTMNSDFFATRLDAAGLASLVQAWQAGAITQETLFRNLVAGEIIADDEDFEDYRETLSADAGPAPMSDDELVEAERRDDLAA